MNKIKTLLFGMTGFGNNALKALTASPMIELTGVFTPVRFKTPFPYYECEALHEVAARAGVRLFEGLRIKDDSTRELIRTLRPDLIVAASFNQILPASVISIPAIGVINIHPSLLPKYRGATPTYWSVLNGESLTGITVHFIEDEKIDNGRIITQTSLAIDPEDTEGGLRQRLALLSEGALNEAVELIRKKGKESFPAQNDAEATWFPKRALHDVEIPLDRPFTEIKNRIRAMTPYPGAFLTHHGRRYRVVGARPIGRNETLPPGGESIEVRTLECAVEFKVLKENADV